MSKSPKFFVTQKGNYFDKKTDVKNLTKKLKTIDKYKDSEMTDPSLLSHPSNREFGTENEWLQFIIQQLENSEPEVTTTTSNISDKERTALRELRLNKEIIIKKSDKINIIVIMDAEYYKTKLVLQDHLEKDTYEVATDNCDKEVFKNQTKLVGKYKDCLTEKEVKFITKYDWKTSNFNVNSKIIKCK